MFIGVFSSHAQTCPPGYIGGQTTAPIIINGQQCYVTVQFCSKLIGNDVHTIFISANFSYGCVVGANLGDWDVINQIHDIIVKQSINYWHPNHFNLPIPYCASGGSYSTFTVIVGNADCYRRNSDGITVSVIACPDVPINCTATYGVCREENLTLRKVLISKSYAPMNSCPEPPDWNVEEGSYETPCMPYCF